MNAESLQNVVGECIAAGGGCARCRRDAAGVRARHATGALFRFLEGVGQTVGELLGFLASRPPVDAEGELACSGCGLAGLVRPWLRACLCMCVGVAWRERLCACVRVCAHIFVFACVCVCVYMCVILCLYVRACDPAGVSARVHALVLVVLLL